MRAAEQAHPSLNSPATLRATFWRVVQAVLITAVLLVIWRPTVVHAQATARSAQDSTARIVPRKAAPAKAPVQRDTSTSTHVVKAGETLWSLATRYYGDGHQWRALAARNGIPLTADTALRVGRRLIVPSRGAVVAAAAARPASRDTTIPSVATTPATAAPTVATTPGTAALTVAPRKSGTLSSQTSGKASGGAASGAAAAGGAPNSAAAADTSALSGRVLMRPQIKAEKLLSRGPQRVGLVEPGAVRAARAANEPTTIFVRTAPDSAEATAVTRALLGRAVIAPRHGEYLAAPLVVANTGWEKAGRVGLRLEADSAMQHSALRGARLDADRDRARDAARPQLADEVELTAPAGSSLAVGDRVVAVRPAGLTAAGGRVAIPTGVLQVTRAEAGKPLRASVRSLSGVIEPGQAVLLIEGQAAPGDARAEAVTGRDLETDVAWIDATEIRPSQQSYLLLTAGAAQGVQAGDEFALVRARASGGEEQVALVRIVRSGPLGSTAVVVRQFLPEIVAGLTARRVGRVK